MPIRYTRTRICLEDRCSVEDALTLADHLRAHPGSRVTLAKCTGLHGAVVQVLMALAPTIATLPTDPAMKRLLGALTSDPILQS